MEKRIEILENKVKYLEDIQEELIKVVKYQQESMKLIRDSIALLIK